MTPVDLVAARKVAAEARALNDKTNVPEGPIPFEDVNAWLATSAAARGTISPLSALVEQMAEEIERLRATAELKVLLEGDLRELRTVVRVAADDLHRACKR